MKWKVWCITKLFILWRTKNKFKTFCPSILSYTWRFTTNSWPINTIFLTPKVSQGKLYLKFRIGPLWWVGSELCLVSLAYMQYFHDKIFYMCLYYFVATSFLKMLLAMKNNWMRGVGEQPFQLRKYSRLIFFARNVKQFSIVFCYKLGFTIFKLHKINFDTCSKGKILD